MPVFLQDSLDEAGLDGRRVLKWILSKLCVRVWSGLPWFKLGTGSVFFVNVKCYRSRNIY